MAIGWLSVGLVAFGAESQEERYNTISQRNAFGLKPPPEPPPPPPPPAPTTTVKLTGIIKLNNNRRAVLLIQEQGKQPESKVLTEQQTSGPVEVLAIDPDEGTVKIKNGDQEVTLNMVKDGVKTPPAPPQPTTQPQPAPGIPIPGQIVPPAAPPGQPANPGAAPVPGAVNPENPNGTAPPMNFQRPMRTPSSFRPYMMMSTNPSAPQVVEPPR